MTKDSSGQTTAVQVALRIRPLNDRDRAQPRFANLSNDDVLKIHNSTVQVVPQNKLFTFDHVFGTTSTQEEIFSALGDNLIRKFVEGYNITILAYGQTSSGKTYTMGTAADGGHNTNDEGIVPRSMALLFDILNNNNNESIRPISPTSSISSSTSASNKSNSRLRPKSRIATNRSSHIPNLPNTNNPHKTKFTVKVSFIEIYNEDLHDLLNSAPLEELPPITIREDTKGRIYWTGVKEVLVHSTDDVLYYLEQGTQNRATGSTDMNEKSSRSHAIFSVSLKQEKWVSSQLPKDKIRPTSSLSSRSSKTPNSARILSNTPQEDGEWLITTSKFHFVDLAGSERLKRTAAEGDRRKEGININAGLLALGNVISALGDPSKKNKIHVPYRDSKLTRLLQDSLGGSATTLMIACASPVEYNLSETLNTLQYANRARNIKNKSEKNQVEEWMTTENIELLRSLIGKLKQELNYIKSNHSPTDTINDDEEDMMDNETFHDQRMLISDLQRQLEELDGEASVTRERNRIVEKELQRIRTMKSLAAKAQEEEDFQHLVEPVIEEYEKSVSKLESQLALTRAALNHSDIGFEEQQNKLSQLENLIRTQEQTITELRLRLTKLLEREQSNEGYIHELESKLMKSANETTKDHEMLNELKNKIMKFKETDENTEQYIHSLEQRLAAGDIERNNLRSSIEDLEAKIEAKEKTNVELLKRLSKTTSNTNTEKLILKELDEVNAKYVNLEKERDALQERIKALEKENSSRVDKRNSVHESNGISNNISATLDDELKSTAIGSPSKYNNNRKSFANEIETPSSIAALNLLQSESRVKEETERANRLQLTLDRLEYDHQETLKELDEVLQRYHETLEQLDFLERDSSSTTAHEEDTLPMPNNNLDLSKEIAQAKEQEKEAYLSKITQLEHTLASQKTELDKIQKLEHELAVANKQIYILKQMESEHKAKTEVETILEKMNTPKDNFKELLELEKKQTKNWKAAHGELKRDIEKLTLDLDEKENYIVELKQKVVDHTARQVELQTSLDESNQQSTGLQKRLAETLASLTVLKLSHDGLLKKTSGDIQEKEAQHQTELKHVQCTLDDINQVLSSTTLDKDTALQKMHALELELKQTMVEQEERMVFLTSNNEKKVQDLNEKLATLESELESSKETLVTQNQRLKEITGQHTSTVLALEENIHQLKAELAGYQSKASQDQSHHVEQMSSLEVELFNLNQSHSSLLESMNKEHQEEIDQLKSENERLNMEYDSLMELLDTTQLKLEKLKSEHQSANEKLKLEHQIACEKLKSEHQIAYDNLKSEHQSTCDNLNSEYQSAYEKLKSEHQVAYDSLKSEHQSMYEKLKSEHQSAIEKLKSEHQSIYNNLKSDHQNLQSESVSRERDIHSHQTSVTELQHQFDQLEAKYNEETLEYTKMIETLTSENESLLQSKQEEIEELEAELDMIHAQYEKELIILNEKIDVLQHEHALIKNKHSEEMMDHKKVLDSIQLELQTLQLEQGEEKRMSIKPAKAEKEELPSVNKDVTLELKEIQDLTRELELLRTEKEHQRQTIDQHVIKIKELQEKTSSQNHINSLQTELNELKQENMEYTSLSEELEKEIQRMTREKDVLAEDLDRMEEKMSDIKSILGVISDDEVIPKLMSIVETQGDQSDVNNNDIYQDGSGAISQQQGPDSTVELKNYQKEIQDLVTSRDTMKKQLLESEKIISKLEKQLEQVLNKKKGFMCF